MALCFDIMELIGFEVEKIRQTEENKNKYNNFVKTFKYFNLVLKDFYFDDESYNVEDDEDIDLINEYYNIITLYEIKKNLKNDYNDLNKTLQNDFNYLN